MLFDPLEEQLHVPKKNLEGEARACPLTTDLALFVTPPRIEFSKT
jgi:hypothetical protein